MGSWDVYCAICGGPTSGANVEELNGRPCKARFRQRRKSAAQPEDGRYRRPSWLKEQGSSKADALEYDLVPLEEEDQEWTREIHVLGWNPDAPNGGGAFVSGPGIYQDWGSVNVAVGDDPNAVELDAHSCYDCGEGPSFVLFPFHAPCYSLLTQVLTTTAAAPLDTSVLWRVMHKLRASCRLALPYGSPAPPAEQFWSTPAGGDMLLAHPTATPPSFPAYLRQTLLHDARFAPLCPRRTSILPLTIESRVRADPFAQLPYDVLHRICAFLPPASPRDIHALARASLPVHLALRRNNQFWKHAVRTHIVPWLPELGQLLRAEPQLLDTLDAHRVYLFLRAATAPRDGMAGPFLHVGNRRRVWATCQALAQRYGEMAAWAAARDGGEEVEAEAVGEAIWAFRERCEEPFVAYGPAEGREEGAAAQWVYRWEQMREGAAAAARFEAFWDREGSLVGVAVVPEGAEGAREVFGKDDGEEGVVGEAVEVAGVPDIQGFVFHIPDMDVRKMKSFGPRFDDGSGCDETEEAQTSVKGITLICKSGNRELGNTSPDFNKRFVPLSKNWCLVGVEGQILGDGKISRLCFMEFPPQAEEYFAHYPFYQANRQNDRPYYRQVLWKDDLSARCNGVPAWENSNLRFNWNFAGAPGTDLNQGFVPLEPLLFAADKDELRQIKRISGRVVSAATGRAPILKDKIERAQRALVGLRVEYVAESGLPTRSIGPPPAHEAGDGWDEGETVHFDVDGPGGEVVTDILCSWTNASLSLKLRTNLRREASFGQEKADTWWKPYRKTPQENILGVAMAFGRRGGPVDAGASTYIKPHEFHVVTCGTSTEQLRPRSRSP